MVRYYYWIESLSTLSDKPAGSIKAEWPMCLLSLLCFREPGIVLAVVCFPSVILKKKMSLFQDIEKCLQALEELSAVPVTSQILQKHSDVITTLKKVCFPCSPIELYRKSYLIIIEHYNMIFKRLTI